MIARALDIIDKYRYAPSGELASEEVRKFLDFVQLYDTVCDAAKIAREAFDCEELYDSVCKWRELFGNEFPPAPKPSKSNSSTGFTTRTEKSAAIPEGRFA